MIRSEMMWKRTLFFSLSQSPSPCQKVKGGRKEESHDFVKGVREEQGLQSQTRRRAHWPAPAFSNLSGGPHMAHPPLSSLFQSFHHSLVVSFLQILLCGVNICPYSIVFPLCSFSSFASSTKSHICLYLPSH